MTARKKSAIGMWISGTTFIGMGTVLWLTASTPSWASLVLTVIGLVANAIGYVVTLPKVE